MKPERYREIFESFEETLLTEGGNNLSQAEIRAELNKYKKVAARQDSDDNCYRQLVAVIFYAGMRATTVTDKLSTIYRHFPGYEAVLEYDDHRVQEILTDPQMIKNKGKIKACLTNAQLFAELATKHGSFRAFLQSYRPQDSLEGAMALKEDLEDRFHGLGPITSYHYMSELGLPVLKPDRVILRIFSRLGLIYGEDKPLTAVKVGREIAEATEHPLRYVDIVMVACGQMSAPQFGLTRGICLEKEPECHRCQASEYCRYYKAGSEDSQH